MFYGGCQWYGIMALNGVMFRMYAEVRTVK